MTMEQAYLREGSKSGCRDHCDFAVALIDELDKLSPKDAGGRSIYKLARDAYAGPSRN